MTYGRNLVLVLCVVGVVTASNSNDDFKQIDSIHDESPCLSEGGMCTIATDCPEGNLAEKSGLCPEQRSRGVECCYGMSVKETRCQKSGGRCMKDCIEYLIFRKATDCQNGTICCILVE